MVYFDNWDDFASASEQLLVSAPSKTRYSFKYRQVDGLLVLKVTDDKSCLKYKTDQKADVRKMEALTMRIMDVMTSKKSDEDIVEQGGDASP